MSQLQLFRPSHVDHARLPPDLAFIRKSLNWLMRLVREAEIMPWSDFEAASQEKQFLALATFLPENEAEAMTCEFRRQLLRLRSAG